MTGLDALMNQKSIAEEHLQLATFMGKTATRSASECISITRNRMRAERLAIAEIL